MERREIQPNQPKDATRRSGIFSTIRDGFSLLRAKKEGKSVTSFTETEDERDQRLKDQAINHADKHTPSVLGGLKITGTVKIGDHEEPML